MAKKVTLHLTVSQETRLAFRLAAIHQSKKPCELLTELVEKHFAEELRKIRETAKNNNPL